MKKTVPLVAAATLLAALSCSVDQGPLNPAPDVSGELTLVVHSPNGPEGAALIDIAGAAVTGVSADPASAYVFAQGSGLRIAVVRAVPGELRVNVAVSDTTTRLGPQLVQVAGPSSELRASLASYTVEVQR